MTNRYSARLEVLLALGILSGMFLVARARVWAGPLRDDDKPAVATLRVLPSRPAVMLRTNATQTEFRIYQQTQAALLRSSLVLEKVLDDPEIAALPSIARQDDPVEWLRHNLEVTIAPNTEVMDATLGGSVPSADRAPLLRAIIEAYNKYIVHGEAEDRLRRLQYLEKLSGEYVDELKSKRERLRKVAAANGGEPDWAAQRAEAALGERDRLLLDLRLKEVEAQTLLERHKGRNDGAELEDRVAVLAAQKQAVEEERTQLEEQIRNRRNQGMDLRTEEEQVDVLKQTSSEVRKEIEALKIELTAPARVQVVSWPKLPKR